jgi:hypothetical protein
MLLPNRAQQWAEQSANREGEVQRSTMHLAVVAVIALCAQVLFVQAQTKETAKFKPRNLKVIGCLQAGSSKDEVTIIGSDGKKYELTSGRMQLTKYVGQKVQVTGAERMEEGGVGLIRVSSLKKINNTCK